MDDKILDRSHSSYLADQFIISPTVQNSINLTLAVKLEKLEERLKLQEIRAVSDSYCSCNHLLSEHVGMVCNYEKCGCHHFEPVTSENQKCARPGCRDTRAQHDNPDSKCLGFAVEYIPAKNFIRVDLSDDLEEAIRITVMNSSNPAREIMSLLRSRGVK